MTIPHAIKTSFKVVLTSACCPEQTPPVRLAYQRALSLPTQLLGLLALGFLELLLLVDEPRDLRVLLLDLLQLLLVDGSAALQPSPTTNVTSTPRRRATTTNSVTTSLAEKRPLKTAVRSTPYTTFRMRQHVVIHQREIYINAIVNIKPIVLQFKHNMPFDEGSQQCRAEPTYSLITIFRLISDVRNSLR